MQGCRNDALPRGLFHALTNSLDVGFLPVDFLCILGRSAITCDASGMEVLDKQTIRCCIRKFEHIEAILAMSEWAKMVPLSNSEKSGSQRNQNVFF